MKYVVTINGKSYEVEVERGAAQLTKVTQAAPAAQASPAAAPVPAPAAAAAAVAPAAGCEVIGSPMPGVVVEVKKEAGTRVKRGETLLVLEAMKMENEITAPRDGTVAQIFAAKGATVATGAPLVALR